MQSVKKNAQVNVDDESHSLYYMHGFKTSQGDIQDILKFVPNDNLQMTENQFEYA